MMFICLTCQLKKDCTAGEPKHSTCSAPNGPMLDFIPPDPIVMKTSELPKSALFII